MGEWKLVSAGHPEGEAVLVWDGTNRWLAEHDPFRNTWFALAGDDCHAWDIETEKIVAVPGVTHWRHLPKPPA
jgi:hypothetical protein